MTAPDRLWTFDANGNELTMTDAQSQVTTYAYDTANRRTSTTWPDHVAGSAINTFGYGITAVAYDAAGQSLRTTDQKGDTITQVYDLAGRRTSRDYRDAAGWRGSERSAASPRFVVARGYNNQGLLSTLTYAGGTIDTRTYDNGGRLTSEALGNGLTVTTGYITGENLLASITNATVGNYSYTWDANHNKTAETITGAMSGKGFAVPGGGYDAEDRLTAWNRSDSALNRSWTLCMFENRNGRRGAPVQVAKSTSGCGFSS